jgi:hypothetical protein
MTDRTLPELAQVAAAMARHALRIDPSAAESAQEEQAQAALDQGTLMADLDRAELEIVARGLAALLAEMTDQLAKATGASAERLLDRFVRRFAAEAAKTDDEGSG